ncbi:MAG: tetratricopeptide repeat protein [Candidatus Cryptobacteroides sp.]|nr:hypothetical protein [Bacteroidales bacterium]
MKKSVSLSILISIAALFVSGNLFAQGKWGADSAECIKYMSYYKEYYKQKAYDEATPNWRKAYSLCPATASQNMLIDGAVLMRRLISKNASDAAYRNALVDTLLTLHETRAQYYPKYAVTALNNKGLDMANYIKNDSEKLYTGYEGIIERNAEQTKSQILLYDLQAAIDQYQGGSLDAETVINIFQRNSDLLEKAPSNNEIEKEQNQKVKQDMGNVFAASKVASCDHLIELYGPRIEADPENLKLAQTIVKTMSMTDDCNSNDIYLKAVTTMYKLEPSANSAYYLFKLHSARGNVDEAIKYMEEAIASDDSDSYTDADWNYELATYYFKNGMNSKAFECANTVAASSEKLAGKAYFLIGTIWGATRCGGDEIAARAPFWVACDYMIKAKNADETLTEAANQYISQYSTYFPKSEEAFMYDITNGQSYTVVCGGMRANTTVRTNK